MTDIEKHSNKRIKRRETPRERKKHRNRQTGTTRKTDKDKAIHKPPTQRICELLKNRCIKWTETYLLTEKEI